MESVRWQPQPPAYVIDIRVYLHATTGELMAASRAGGVSTSDTPKSVRGANRNWRVSQGVHLPADLAVIEDPPQSGHWLWEPTYDMPFINYYKCLLTVNRLFVLYP